MTELPKRKHTRLKDYDDSLPGYYFVTICLGDETLQLSQVGREQAPALHCRTWCVRISPLPQGPATGRMLPPEGSCFRLLFMST